MAAPKTTPTPDHVELSATGYSLGALDFVTPVLSQEHKLSAPDYIVEGPFEFCVPAWRYGICRITWVDAGSDVDLGGRPLKIPKDAEARMIAAVESWLTERRITDLKHVSLADRATLKKYVRALAKNVPASDSTLHRRIVKPAVQNVAVRATTKT
jgi:hypothetical protein